MSQDQFTERRKEMDDHFYRPFTFVGACGARIAPKRIVCNRRYTILSSKFKKEDWNREQASFRCVNRSMVKLFSNLCMLDDCLKSQVNAELCV